MVKRRRLTRVEDILREKIARREIAISRDLQGLISEAEITTEHDKILEHFSRSPSRRIFLRQLLRGVPGYLS